MGTSTAPDWHVLLQQPAITPTQTIVVPQNQGSEFTGSHSGAPAWSVPSEPQYGCSNMLGMGDPLVGIAFKVTVNKTTYHPQDEAFLPWFAREAPSTSINGLYTYLGTFKTYSPGCS